MSVFDGTFSQMLVKTFSNGLKGDSNKLREISAELNSLKEVMDASPEDEVNETTENNKKRVEKLIFDTQTEADECVRLLNDIKATLPLEMFEN